MDKEHWRGGPGGEPITSGRNHTAVNNRNQRSRRPLTLRNGREASRVIRVRMRGTNEGSPSTLKFARLLLHSYKS